VLDLKDLIGAMFNDMGYGVAVGGAEEKGLQNEQIEGSLEEISFEWRGGAFGHCVVALRKIIYWGFRR